MLTPEEKKRLAEEAEKLAMECLEGRAPAFVIDSYCGCAIGEIIHRVLPDRYVAATVPIVAVAFRDFHALATWIDKLVSSGEQTWDLGLVSDALIEGPAEFGVTPHSAAVFPLLALRDALLEAE